LKNEGKVEHIGLSNVTETELREAQALTPIASIQNRYNFRDRGSDALVDVCEQESMAFLPWAPIQDLKKSRAVNKVAERHDATPRQVVLAWLLRRSPAMVPIPGTGSVEHLESNVAAASLELSSDEYNQLT
jgi:pyridoxine 4-dehydrogenase